jgi:hypothetical protein
METLPVVLFKIYTTLCTVFVTLFLFGLAYSYRENQLMELKYKRWEEDNLYRAQDVKPLSLDQVAKMHHERSKTYVMEQKARFEYYLLLEINNSKHPQNEFYSAALTKEDTEFIQEVFDKLETAEYKYRFDIVNRLHGSDIFFELVKM